VISRAHCRSALFRRADQIAPPRPLQPRHGLGAGHAPVHHPDPVRKPIAGLHRVHDLFDRGDIGPIPREEFVPERDAAPGHDQRNAHLLAVRPVIAAVAPRGQRVARRQPLEVRARHVVEQQVVRQGEELPQALPQVLLDRGFVRQESIQRAVEAMVIDPLGRDPQQVLERGRPIPVLGDVQLARGLTQPGDHRHRGHLRPGDRFAAPRQERGAEVVEPQGPPQRPPQPHLAERPRALDADPIEADRDRVLRGGGCLEELPLIGAPGDRLRQPPGAHAPLAVELAEVRGGLLHHLPPAPHRAHQPPVRVRPSTLPHHRVPQVHRTPPRPIAIARNRKARKGPRLALHVDFAPRRREIHVLSAAVPAEKLFRCPNWRS